MQLDVKLTEQVVLATALLAIDMDIGEHDDLVAEFGRSLEVISSTASTIASMIYDKIKHKMALDHRMIERLTQRLVDAIFTKVDEADYPSDEEADVFEEESDMSSDSDSDSNCSEDSVIESGDDSKFDD
ncbi:hypothetical protein PInf_007626 [Phytophthora infestans]|nr:hypothetical protein PInf_007626 [Phytophthora infestans]